MKMNYKIILIGGGSASGKTYISNKIKQTLKEENILHICIDDYYNDFSSLSMEERNKINYDSPDTFDWKLLYEHINSLRQGQPIDKPVYDYTIHNRCSERIKVYPRPIIIIEGIMALVKNDIRKIGDLKVFINALTETRFRRRFERDRISRGRSPESIINQYNNQVIPVFKELIEPTKQYADLIINNEDNDDTDINRLIEYIKQYI